MGAFQPSNLVFFTVLFATIDGVSNTRQLSCFYHSGRKLICGNATSNLELSSCSMCDHFEVVNMTDLLANPEKCPRYDKCERYIEGEYHRRTAIIVNGVLEDWYLKQIIKPGQVQSFKISRVNETSLFVNWTKPDDFDNYERAYKYNITVVTDQGDKEEITVNGTQEMDLSQLVSVNNPWTKITVTVTGKMVEGGFYGDSLSKSINVSMSGPDMKEVKQDGPPAWNAINVVVITIITTIAVIVGIWVYTQRKQVCRKVHITLPRESDKVHTHAQTLLPHCQRESKGNESQPVPDSGHCSLATGNEQDSNRATISTEDSGLVEGPSFSHVNCSSDDAEAPSETDLNSRGSDISFYRFVNDGNDTESDEENSCSYSVVVRDDNNCSSVNKVGHRMYYDVLSPTDRERTESDERFHSHDGLMSQEVAEERRSLVVPEDDNQRDNTHDDSHSLLTNSSKLSLPLSSLSDEDSLSSYTAVTLKENA